MQSRRDHLQAYQFATGRLASSLVTGDPGTGEAPMRRSGLGATFGILLTVLLVVAAAVYGLLKPVRSTAWARDGALIVEKETGNRYLYSGGLLHPTANYASALLAVGSGAAVEQVPRAALADVPRGVPIGIPGAPDDVAEPTAVLTGAWADCLRPGTTGGEALDFAPATARPVRPGTRVLVAAPDGTRYVVWHDTKYEVDARSSLIALGLDTEQPVKATAAWLDALPSGTPVAPAAVPGVGAPGRTVAGSPAKVGRLFRTEVGGVSHYYVLRADGVAPLTATESALLAGEPGEGQPTQVSPGDIAAVQASSDTSLMHRLPDLLNAPDTTADGGAALCLLHPADGGHATVVRETAAGASPSGVLVSPDHAVLARPPAGTADADTPDPYLITDQGVKYELVGQAAEALGYGDLTPRTLPAAVLDRIPTGVRLTRAQALAPVPGPR
ncbi:type VII secretion protein EccB [Streptantibioticus parmotrematis]|uniref:type VII secretion protein EccB n=1 Tax=Streptantibioticus parmotrematis TaxID=2873249 RepID=UPI0033CE863D